MSLWTPDSLQREPEDTQVSLPLPPSAGSRPHGPALASNGLPPPLPPSSLDSARIRLTLERVKIELGGVQEALDEVLVMKEAIGSLQEEVRLVQGQNEDQAAVSAESVIVSTRLAIDELLAPLRQSLSIVTDSARSPSHRICAERIAAVETAAITAANEACSRMDRFEERLASEVAAATSQFMTSLNARTARLEEMLDGISMASEPRGGGMLPSGPKPGKVELTPNSRLSPTYSPEPQRMVLARSVSQPVASSSAHGLDPSPPLRRMRRFVPSLQDAVATPRGSRTGLGTVTAASPSKLRPVPARTPLAHSTSGASSSTPAAHARRTPKRQSTKRRLIEQDESWAEGQAELDTDGTLVKSSDSLPPQTGAHQLQTGAHQLRLKRRRVIEQDATTPSGSHEETSPCDDSPSTAVALNDSALQHEQSPVVTRLEEASERRRDIDEYGSEDEPDTL